MATNLQQFLEQFTPDDLALEIATTEYERDLAAFFRACWSSIDPSPYHDNWHIEAICLPGDTEIITDAGPKPISEIVDGGWNGRVLSYSHDSDSPEWRPVLDRMKSPASPSIKLTLGDGNSLTLTGNHPIFVRNVGYVRADQIRAGQTVLQVRHVRRGFSALAERGWELLLAIVPLRPRTTTWGGEELPSVRSLWRKFLPVGKQTSRLGDGANWKILQRALFWRRQNRPQKPLMSDVWRQEVMGKAHLHGVSFRSTENGRVCSVPSVRKNGVSQSGAMESIVQTLRRVLQSSLPRRVYEGPEQSELHSRLESGSVSVRVSDNAATGFGAGWSLLLSLFDRRKDGHASHRCEQEKQRDLESGDALPKVSRRSGWNADKAYRIVESVVSSVERDIQLSAPVFNIAVGVNNNYFANGVLVHNCDHLMAVTDGQISRLLINQPPRTTKTLLTSVAWQAWTWAQRYVGPLSGPQVSFLCLSYGSQLSLDNALTANRLIKSEWYQKHWGSRFQIAKDKDSSERFDNTKGGSRISSGFDGATMGRGGAIRIIDDPHKAQEVESDLIRKEVIKTYDEVLSSRFTDLASSAEVIIMQRLAEDDLSGHVLDKGGFVHLNLPMEYDPRRHCVTVIGWQDPRGLDENGDVLEGIVERDKGGGEVEIVIEPGSPMAQADGVILDAERFPPAALDAWKERLGAFGTAGQLQQSPAPRGGGVIQRDWWRLWPHDHFPAFGTVIVSVDTAYTEKEENDYSAATVWGVFPGIDGNPLLMLKAAWQERMELPALTDRLIKTCREHKADYLLIEAKASGLSAAQAVKKLVGDREWSTIVSTPKGDKLSRLIAAQPTFSGKPLPRKDGEGQKWAGGTVYAPDRAWADLVIGACASFPKTKHKDIVDTVSQAIEWLRRNGVALYKEEYDDEQDEIRRQHVPTRQRALYDV